MARSRSARPSACSCEALLPIFQQHTDGSERARCVAADLRAQAHNAHGPVERLQLVLRGVPYKTVPLTHQIRHLYTELQVCARP
jgi:hypothetical protein